jgi:hypothetical protein
MDKNEEENNFIEKHSDLRMKLFNISSRLKGLSMCFENVGNTSMSDELYQIATELDEICEGFNKIQAGQINDRYKKAKKTTGAILTALLENVKE